MAEEETNLSYAPATGSLRYFTPVHSNRRTRQVSKLRYRVIMMILTIFFLLNFISGMISILNTKISSNLSVDKIYLGSNVICTPFNGTECVQGCLLCYTEKLANTEEYFLEIVLPVSWVMIISVVGFVWTLSAACCPDGCSWSKRYFLSEISSREEREDED